MRTFAIIALLALVLACVAEAKVRLDKIQTAANMDLAASIRARARAETEMVHAEATKTGMLYFDAPSVPKSANFYHPGVKYYRGRINAHSKKSAFTFDPDAAAGSNSLVEVVDNAQLVETGVTYSSCAQIDATFAEIVTFGGGISGTIDIRESSAKDEKLSVTLSLGASLGIGFSVAKLFSVSAFLEGSLSGTVEFPDKKFKDVPSWLVVRSIQAIVMDMFNKQLSTDTEKNFKKVAARMSQIRTNLFPVKALGNSYTSPEAVRVWNVVYDHLLQKALEFEASACNLLVNDAAVAAHITKAKGLAKGVKSDAADVTAFKNLVEPQFLIYWRYSFLEGYTPTKFKFFEAKSYPDQKAFETAKPKCGDIMDNFAKIKTPTPDQRWQFAARALVCYFFIYAGPSDGERTAETPFIFGEGGTVENLNISIKTVFKSLFPDDNGDGSYIKRFIGRSIRCANKAVSTGTTIDWATTMKNMKKDKQNASFLEEFQNLVFPEARAQLEAKLKLDMAAQQESRIIVSDISMTGRIGLSIGKGDSNLRNMCDDEEFYTFTPAAYERKKAPLNPAKPNDPRPWTTSERLVMHEFQFPNGWFKLTLVNYGSSSKWVKSALPGNPAATKSVAIEVEFPAPSLPSFEIFTGAASSALEIPVMDYIGVLMEQIPCGIPDKASAIGPKILEILKNLFSATKAANPFLDNLVTAVEAFFSSKPDQADKKKQLRTKIFNFATTILLKAFTAAITAVVSAVAKAVFGDLKVEVEEKMAVEIEILPTARGREDSDGDVQAKCPKGSKFGKEDKKPWIKFAVKAFTKAKVQFTVPPGVTQGWSVTGTLVAGKGEDVVLRA